MGTQEHAVGSAKCEAAAGGDELSEADGRSSGRSGEHRWLGYENPAPGRFVAVCSCGWRSQPYTSAGLAGSACDQHRADAAAREQAEPELADGDG